MKFRFFPRHLRVLYRVGIGFQKKIVAMEPIIDLQSDAYFMSEALRMAVRAYEAEEVPIGAIVVRAGKIIARAFNHVELLKDETAHTEMLALPPAAGARRSLRLSD